MGEVSLRPAEKPKPVPFRITVGVTGHRKLTDSEELRASIRRVLDHVRQRYLHSDVGNVRFCALTPLAEGADCIVAEEILSSDDYDLPNIKAVLPLTVDEYRKDFTTAESRATFESLMDRAQVVLTLRDRSIEDEYADVSPGTDLIQKARRQAYEDVGRFVVDHCDVLIAIWDGEPARGKGGTADTVLYARRTGCPFYTINADSPDMIEYCGEKKEKARYQNLDRCHEAIGGFNRRIHTFEDYAPYVESLDQDLFQSPPHQINSAISDDTKDVVRRRLMPYYAMASDTAFCGWGLRLFIIQAGYRVVYSVVMGALLGGWQ